MAAGSVGHGTLQRALLAAALAFLTSCAAPPPIEVYVVVPPNPDSGPALRLGEVADLRAFEPMAREGYGHTILGGATGPPALTERIVGRRQTFGGDYISNVLLVEGRTVAQVVAETVTRGFREAGYRVLGPGAAGYDYAPAIDVAVRRFWVRMNTQRAGVGYDFWAEVHITAPVPPFQEGGWVCTNRFVGRGGPSAGIWPYIIGLGLDNVSGKLRDALILRRLGVIC